MKLHFIFKSFILFVLAFLMIVPASIQAAQPKDDNTSPYFESAAVRDSFKNCKKPIWTNNWDDRQPTSTRTILWSSTMTPNITT